jgi:hypothetical protein
VSQDKDFVIKDAKEKLGFEYDEILKKEWKVTEIPEDYDQRLGKDGRKLNPKSLKNLVQYKRRTKKQKEVALAQLRFKEEKKEVKNVELPASAQEYKLLTKLKDILPIDDFFHEDEIPVFFQIIDFYLQDFDEDDLTANDIDDLLNIAQTRVLEIRLLKHGKAKPAAQLDISQAIERLRKQTEKAKENLLVRRKDRLSGKDASSFTIVDLVASYENERKLKLSKELSRMQEEEDEALSKHDRDGNRTDPDAKILELDFSDE